jgi:hypothetical protein
MLDHKCEDCGATLITNKDEDISMEEVCDRRASPSRRAAPSLEPLDVVKFLQRSVTSEAMLPHEASRRESLAPTDVKDVIAPQCREEELLLALLPLHVLSNGRPCFSYKAGWGPHASHRARKSVGYTSRAAMAHAIWSWAGIQWAHRVGYVVPLE